MTRSRATVLLDSERRSEQLAFIRERDPEAIEVGDHVWASLTDEQAALLAGQHMWVELHPDADYVELPAVRFRPSEELPAVPADLTAQPPSGSITAYFIVLFKVP